MTVHFNLSDDPYESFTFTSKEYGQTFRYEDYNGVHKIVLSAGTITAKKLRELADELEKENP